MQTLTLRQRLSPTRFLRGPGPEIGPVQLDRSRIFILPSSSGMLFAVVLLVMLLGAINYANNMGYMFTFLLGSMAMVSILHSYRNLAQLQFAAQALGERATFEIQVGNPGERTRHVIDLELPDQAPVTVDAAASMTSPASGPIAPATRRVTCSGRRSRVTRHCW